MRVMISCGEPSGDLYAGALARELTRLAPDLHLTGFGGPRLAAAGAALIGTYAGLTVTGLVEALEVVPRSYLMLRRLVAAARERPPDVFVAIDFPDFNFRLLEPLARLGVPIVYYISPQLWAWRPGRLITMRKYVRKVLVIFPFEEAIYREGGVPVEFVGHPLVELIPATRPRAEVLESIGLSPGAPVVAVLPGSRPSEIRHILPTLADAAERIRRAVPDAQFVLAQAPGLARGQFAAFDRLAAAGVPAAVVDGATDEVLEAADIVLTASGTATVQTALHGRPMVIVYRLSPMTYALARRAVRVSTYGMVNLIAGRRIVPEVVQRDFTPERVAAEAIDLLTNHARADAMRRDLADVRTKLGGPGASRRAAEAILAICHL